MHRQQQNGKIIIKFPEIKLLPSRYMMDIQLIEKDGKTLFNRKDYGCSGDISKQKIKKFIVHINTNTFPSVHP